MTWLIVGSWGQLGRELLAALADQDVVGIDRADVDITDPAAVDAAFASFRPTVVVNAAAYTAVDAAETDRATALSINGTAVEHLARAAAAAGVARLLHVSTDYVFPGTGSTPYAEDAEPGPASVYGQTKLVGERAVLGLLPDSGYVVRTAWLYGEHGNNFVKTMLRLERQRETLSVVDDQIGQPTAARDLAHQIRLLAESAAPAGIYHGTNSGQTSWFGLTQEIFGLIGADPDRVRPTDTASFPRPAPRPAYSVLGHDRWAAVGLPEMRPWQEALAETLPALRRAL
ncbi:MAG: dTDP-4-dehydrorhamnose reductase [Propionicimonas sp.]